MRKQRVAVIHYMPLEIYPPVMNLIRTFNTREGAVPLDIYTTRLNKNIDLFTASPSTHIKRYGVSGNAGSIVTRLARYIHYYLSTFFMLVKTKPDSVLYYDTISSFPAILYKMYRSSSRLFVHYNEYMSPTEYHQGMFLVRWFHKMEKKIYAKTVWLSHTNQERMDLFKADLPNVCIPHQHVIPNFPPANWSNGVTRTDAQLPVKIIYAGALSMDTMYTQLFAEWIMQQKGAVTWHIYTLNITDEAANYIKSLPADSIRLFEGVDYYQLPEVLKKYDVGVILYNGHIPNYVYNAPNKLFEYAASGLDVWFPHHMLSSLRYVTIDTYPKIQALNFQHLDNMHLEQIISKKGLSYKAHPFSCEQALSLLLQKFVDNIKSTAQGGVFNN